MTPPAPPALHPARPGPPQVSVWHKPLADGKSRAVAALTKARQTTKRLRVREQRFDRDALLRWRQLDSIDPVTLRMLVVSLKSELSSLTSLLDGCNLATHPVLQPMRRRLGFLDDEDASEDALDGWQLPYRCGAGVRERGARKIWRATARFHGLHTYDGQCHCLHDLVEQERDTPARIPHDVIHPAAACGLRLGDGCAG